MSRLNRDADGRIQMDGGFVTREALQIAYMELVAYGVAKQAKSHAFTTRKA